MTDLQEFKEIFAEVKGIMIEGYRLRGKEENALLIEQIDTGELADFVIPIAEAVLQKENMDVGKVASL